MYSRQGNSLVLNTSLGQSGNIRRITECNGMWFSICFKYQAFRRATSTVQVLKMSFAELEVCFHVFPLTLSGCCNGGGQGALDNGPSEESDVTGETAAGEPEPGRASAGTSPGGEQQDLV